MNRKESRTERDDETVRTFTEVRRACICLHRQPIIITCNISQDFHIQELDVLERVLDNALVKFETTTL